MPSIFNNPQNTQNGSVFGKFVINQGDNAENSDEDGADDGEEDPKSVSEDEAKRDDGQAFKYDSPYEQVITLKFEDMKVDKKEAMGAGIVSIEKLKPPKVEDKDGEVTDETNNGKKDNSKEANGTDDKAEVKAEPAKSVRLDFPLLVVKSRAKVVLGIYKMIPKRSVTAVLKNNKLVVSFIVFQIEKDEHGSQKLATFNLKVKFAEEKMAEDFKNSFDSLVN